MGAGPRTVDEWVAYWVTESLAQRAQINAPQALQMNLKYGKFGREGLFYTPYELLPSILAVPAQAVGAALVGNSNSQILRYFVPGTLACAITAPITAATVSLLFITLLELGFTCSVALLSSLFFGLGTMAWPYSGLLFREPHASLALLGTFYLLVKWRQDGRRQHLLYAGLVFGLGLWCKREICFAFPGLFLMALISRNPPLHKGKWKDYIDWRAALWLAIGPALAIALQLALNLYRFGDMFELGYPDLDETGQPQISFRNPIWVGLYGFFLTPGKSIFVYSPPLILGVLGLYWTVKRDKRIGWVLTLSFIGSMLALSSWSHWEGGWCWGPRYTLPLYPLLMVSFAYLAASGLQSAKWRSGFIILLISIGLAGLLAQCLGVFVDWLTYATASQTYILNLVDYQMDFNPWLGHIRFLGAQFEKWHAGEIPEFDLWQCFFLQEGISASLLVGITIFLFAIFMASAILCFTAYRKVTTER